MQPASGHSISYLSRLPSQPIRRLSSRLSWLIRFRRMLGLYAFFYGTLHLFTYVWLFSNFDVHAMLKDIAKRPFITMGMLGWTCLLALAATSNHMGHPQTGRQALAESSSPRLCRRHSGRHPLLVDRKVRRADALESNRVADGAVCWRESYGAREKQRAGKRLQSLFRDRLSQVSPSAWVLGAPSWPRSLRLGWEATAQTGRIENVICSAFSNRPRIFHHPPHRLIRHPMQRSRPMLMQSSQVFRRAVAFVRSQPILRIFLVVTAHPGIAVHLGDDRSRGNRYADRVSINNRLLRAGGIEPFGVDQQKVRLRQQLRDGRQHRHMRCAPYVDRIDRRHIGKTDGDRHSPFAEDAVQPVRGLPAPVASSPRTPRIRVFGGKMTAAATTGPNSAPRPTSSTPATAMAPCRWAARSCLSPQTIARRRRIFSACFESCGATELVSILGISIESTTGTACGEIIPYLE